MVPTLYLMIPHHTGWVRAAYTYYTFAVQHKLLVSSQVRDYSTTFVTFLKMFHGKQQKEKNPTHIIGIEDIDTFESINNSF
jgi:hypothetical protein